MAVAKPIQIVPLHDLAAAAPVSRPRLTYRGGPLLPAVQLFTFFWGFAWQQDPLATLVQQVNQFFDFVVTSPLLDQLAEYSVPSASIGYGTRTGAVILSTDPPATIDDTDVQQLIQHEISSDAAVPQPTPSSLYYVFLPPGVTITLDGAASCSSFCGYHGDINGGTFYAVMPYPDCSGCHISKVQHSHVSIVRFCEVNFGLRSLNARTAASDGMEDCFDFTQSPLAPPQ